MLSKLLPVILLILGTGGGIGAGIMLAPAPEPVESAEASKPAAPKPEAKEPEELSEENQREYIKINNQFVVPVVERENLTSLVVMSLSLEAKKGTTEKVHAYEPKLRDVFLQVLFDHANMAASAAPLPARTCWTRCGPPCGRRPKNTSERMSMTS